MLILLEKSFSQGSIVTWGSMGLNTPYFCQSIRGEMYSLASAIASLVRGYHDQGMRSLGRDDTFRSEATPIQGGRHCARVGVRSGESNGGRGILEGRVCHANNADNRGRFVDREVDDTLTMVASRVGCIHYQRVCPFRHDGGATNEGLSVEEAGDPNRAFILHSDHRCDVLVRQQRVA